MSCCAVRRIDSLHDLLLVGDGRAPDVARQLGQIYGDLLACAVLEGGQQHLGRVWSHWQHAAGELDWKRWNFPDRQERSFADGDRNWINPLACLDEIDCWKEGGLISLAWGWQHRDLNTRNVLVAPATLGTLPSAMQIRLVDLEKVEQSSALLDICWLSFWMLLAGGERESAIREETWDRLPEAFIGYSLERLCRTESGVSVANFGVFQFSLDCIAAAFDALSAHGKIIDDPVILRDMAALTLAGAALANSYYELRNLQRTEEAGGRPSATGWQKARCFFRICARAIESFVVRPRGPTYTDLSMSFAAR